MLEKNRRIVWNQFFFISKNKKNLTAAIIEINESMILNEFTIFEWQAANILLKFNVRNSNMFNMSNKMLANVTDLFNQT